VSGSGCIVLTVTCPQQPLLYWALLSGPWWWPLLWTGVVSPFLLLHLLSHPTARPESLQALLAHRCTPKHLLLPTQSWANRCTPKHLLLPTQSWLVMYPSWVHHPCRGTSHLQVPPMPVVSISL
jgi:hypothetical protein